MPEDSTAKAWQMISAAQTVLLASHVNPDGDAIGSVCALAEALETLGKSCTMALPSRSNGRYRCIPGIEKIIIADDDIGPDDARRLNRRHDLMILLDVATWEQLRGLHEPIRAHRGRLLVIDHHRSRDDLGQVELVDEQSAACGEIVQKLLETKGIAITPTMAAALLVAIAADTGWMRYPSVTPETFHRVARLQQYGADPARVYQQLYQCDTPGKVRLSGEAMAAIRLSDDGRIADMQLTQDMFRRTGTTMRDSESIIDQCSRIEGVLVSLLLVEVDAGHVRASLRSREGSIDVDRIAAHFGGGGHARAAGCRLAMPIAEARESILQVIGQAIAGGAPV